MKSRMDENILIPGGASDAGDLPAFDARPTARPRRRRRLATNGPATMRHDEVSGRLPAVARDRRRDHQPDKRTDGEECRQAGRIGRRDGRGSDPAPDVLHGEPRLEAESPPTRWTGAPNLHGLRRPRVRSRRGRGDSSHFRGKDSRRPCRICARAFSAYYLIRCSRSWIGDVTHARRNCRVPAISVMEFATDGLRSTASEYPEERMGRTGESPEPRVVRHAHASGPDAIGENAFPEWETLEKKCRTDFGAFSDFRRGRSAIASTTRRMAISGLDRGETVGIGKARDGMTSRSTRRTRRESSEESTK